MIVVALFIAGVLLGVGAERLTYRPDPSSDPSVAAPAGGAAPRPKRRIGRVIAWVALVSVVLLVAAGAWVWQRANAVFDSIEKVDVTSVLSPPSGDGTNYLLVGSDNGREGGEQREGVAGARSDTIMVLRMGDDGSTTMLSLNRDLWVDNPATGEPGRLNATYNAGPANLIQAVTENFQIPVHRYIEVDFVSFAGMVDALGGITIDFAHPAFDLGSGLDVKQSGPVMLDGDQALAYVRSRYYAEVIDGEVVLQGGLPDVNRTQRQQTFLRAVMAEAAEERNPLRLLSTADRMSAGLRIDDDMTMWQAARFAWDLRGAEPESVILPVTPRTTSGGAAVLDLQQPEAEAVLAQFR